MIQVWKIDDNSFFTGESIFIEEENLTSLDIIEGFSIGYIKAKWTGKEWVEGATTEEITAWNNENIPTKVTKYPEITRIQKSFLPILPEKEKYCW